MNHFKADENFKHTIQYIKAKKKVIPSLQNLEVWRVLT
jgi:hypothetical protein